MKDLVRIQKELKANKGQYNSFGKYKYRSCEDILESVKPLLGECYITLSDTMEQIGERYYIKATATISKENESVSVTAYAREALAQKGMNDAQITGSSSSYARKYALNGLFAIDDTKDDDTRKPKQVEVKKSKTSEAEDNKLIAEFNKLITKKDYDYQGFLDYFGVKNMGDILENDGKLREAVTKLREKEDKR